MIMMFSFYLFLLATLYIRNVFIISQLKTYL
uniref:Uncharacterized protein n=1 Tax=Anguilla anguilla TaxID=7936 RepID=A0A0E9TNY3_ANGAN